jgi:hypothetical protein
MAPAAYAANASSQYSPESIGEILSYSTPYELAVMAWQTMPRSLVRRATGDE